MAASPPYPTHFPISACNSKSFGDWVEPGLEIRLVGLTGNPYLPEQQRFLRRHTPDGIGRDGDKLLERSDPSRPSWCR